MFYFRFGFDKRQFFKNTFIQLEKRMKGLEMHFIDKIMHIPYLSFFSFSAFWVNAEDGRQQSGENEKQNDG